MTPALSAISTPLARELSNHLWQSTLFAAIVALLALALRRYPARARYWLWLAASAKFLIPFSLLIAIGAHIPRPTHSTPTQTTAYLAPYLVIDELSQPFTATPALTAPIPTTPAPTHHYPTLPTVLAALWLCGFLTILTRWLVQLRRIAKSIRNATPLLTGRVPETLRRIEHLAHIARPIPILSSPASNEPASMEPGVFGVLRPILLWPEAISPHLDDAHLEAILAHEAAHVRRRDNLTSLLPMLVEALFWFHPLVWAMESQLIKERERACDEEVLLLCHHPQAYAESILKVCELCIEFPLTCVSGITGADLKRRIVQIMTARITRKLTLGAKLLLLSAASLAIAMPILLGHATAAQRMMLAAVNGAPMPFGRAAHAMIEFEQTPATGLIAEVQPPSGKDTTSPTATTAPPAPSFDVATIKPNDPSKNPGATSWTKTSPDELKIMGSLKTFIKAAYGIEDAQIAGGPKWLDSDLFEIDAKYSSPVSLAQMKLMFRALLEQRFKLSTHTETKSLPVYSLVVAKGGPKLQQADASGPRGSSWGPTLVRGTLGTGQLAHLLTPVLGRTVIDNTGLNGTYKVDLTWAADDQPSGPSLFTAIQEQLGLKLEPAKGPVATLVIDHAEQPSMDGAELPNPPTSTLTPVSFAQTNPAPAPAQPAQRDYRFEVASIRPGPPDGRLTHPPGPSYTPGRFREERTTIPGLAFQAFGKKQRFELESPQWMNTAYFSIDATIPDGATKADLPIMIQHLLEDRFALKFHHETRQAAGYELVVAKPDPRLAKSATADYDGAKLSGMSGVDTKTGAPQFDKNAGSVDMCFSHDGSAACALHGRNRTMQTLAADLAGKLQAPVTDATGLDGGYDYTLIYTPEQRYVPGPGGYVPVATPPDDPMDYPLLHDALPEQLGLKLQPVKNVPVDVVIIDSANKVPTEN